LIASVPAVLTLVGGTSAEWPAILIFAATIAAFIGLTLFTTGTLFNYIVSLFHHRKIRQGLFGRPIFRTPLEKHFGWMGILAGLGGVILYVVTKLAGLAPTPWFYPVVSTMFVLMGTQLATSWTLVKVLSILSERETQKLQDLNGVSEPASPAADVPVTKASVLVTE
jgi:hypothetical protein